MALAMADFGLSLERTLHFTMLLEASCVCESLTTGAVAVAACWNCVSVLSSARVTSTFPLLGRLVLNAGAEDAALSLG